MLSRRGLEYAFPEESYNVDDSSFLGENKPLLGYRFRSSQTKILPLSLLPNYFPTDEKHHLFLLLVFSYRRGLELMLKKKKASRAEGNGDSQTTQEASAAGGQSAPRTRSSSKKARNKTGGVKKD